MVGGVVDECVQLCQYFFDMKWFCDIIVGVCIDVCYFVGLVVVGGQDQNWYDVVCGVLFFQYCNFVYFWQVDVEDNGVIWFCVIEKMFFFVVESLVNDIVCFFQCVVQLVVQVCVVFYDQNVYVLNFVFCVVLLVYIILVYE